MNKRIRKKHIDLFRRAVMYAKREEDAVWDMYINAKPFKGSAGSRLWRYAMDYGLEGVFCDAPKFNPDRRYVFSVEESPTGVFRVAVERF